MPGHDDPGTAAYNDICAQIINADKGGQVPKTKPSAKKALAPAQGSPARVIKLDKDGVPERAEDWTLEDWQDLWNGIKAIKAKIAARHRVQENGGDER